MGLRRRFNHFLGKGFKTSKFKATVNLAVSRLAVLKNQRQARCSIARSDVVQLLNNNEHERALLRVEQVIKEQNMLDVFVALESYCHLLIERINLIEQEDICPDEVNEAVSSLIYAATRVGEFPELQEIRLIFASWYGKEFVARAVELRNNCGVNPKIVQKLSTRTPSLENRMKVLQDIASDNNIDLRIEETESANISDSTQENQLKPGLRSPAGVSTPRHNEPIQHVDMEKLKMRRYRDVAEAAEAAYESAAYATAAARAAVELARSESTDPDDPTSPNAHHRKRSPPIEPRRAKLEAGEKDLLVDEHMKYELKFKIIPPIHNYDMVSKDGSLRVDKQNETGSMLERSFSASSSDSGDDSDSGAHEHFPLRPPEQSGEEMRTRNTEPLNINRRPISVRTRWTQGY